MTLDDQIEAMDPLKPGQLSRFARYRSPDQLRRIRAEGGRLSGPRLRNVAEALRLLADRADDLAVQEDRTRKAIKAEDMPDELVAALDEVIAETKAKLDD